MSVTICEVGPRDGLQNEAKTLEPALRADLVDRLAATGLRWIEAASFVNPKLVPQMAGAEEVVHAVTRRPGTTYAGLALNERGYERLVESGLDRGQLRRPRHRRLRPPQFQLDDRRVDRLGAPGDRTRACGRYRHRITVSVAFGCPFAGEVDTGRVLDLAATFAEAGAEEVVYADTIGVGVPRQVRALASGSKGLATRIGMHFHNTRNTGFANAYAAIEAGVELLDAAVGGTGGCPFAPKATGNIATEDLVYLLEGQGISDRGRPGRPDRGCELARDGSRPPPLGPAAHRRPVRPDRRVAGTAAPNPSPHPWVGKRTTLFPASILSKNVVRNGNNSVTILGRAQSRSVAVEQRDRLGGEALAAAREAEAVRRRRPTVMRSASTPAACASAARISSRLGAILGSSPIRMQSALTSSQPRARTSSIA